MNAAPLDRFARSGLRHLSAMLGRRFGMEERSEALIYYGTDHRAAKSAPVWIEPQAILNNPDSPVRVSLVEGLAIPHVGEPPKALWIGNRAGFDVFRAAAYWLALQSECAFENRDEHGRPPAAQTCLARLNMIDAPPIRDYARLLRQQLLSWGVKLTTASPWPRGKRYAVALTHDVDSPESLSRLARALQSGLRKGRSDLRSSYWRLREILGRQGNGHVREALFLPPSRRRAWDFEKFCQLEAEAGFRSAFYFSVVHRSAGHPNDVSYDAAARRYVRLVRRLGEAGWEIGLHAAYATCESSPVIGDQVERFRRIFAVRPVGVRHHYLRLSPDAPMGTLAKHASAGLRYDTSVGYNDAPGFRAGTTWPYFIPLTNLESGRDFLELPMTLADMHLPRNDIESATGMVLEHLRRVREIGGLAVFNWHVGHWESCPAWRESYRAAMRWLSEDSESWVATPREVCQWWADSEESEHRS